MILDLSLLSIAMPSTLCDLLEPSTAFLVPNPDPPSLPGGRRHTNQMHTTVCLDDVIVG